MAGMMQEFSEVSLMHVCVCVLALVALGKTVSKQSENGAAAEDDI